MAAGVAIWTGACGSHSGPSAPEVPAPTSGLPSGGPCSVLSGAGTAIQNGTACDATTASVVLMNLRDSDNAPSAACSATVIAPRAVLTAAHCLVGHTASVQIYPGTLPQISASSFHAYPGYSEDDPNALDVGVVLFDHDIGRTPVPLFLSRDAQVGETAIVAGWGNDQHNNADVLRAGPTTISAVGPALLQTQFGTNVAAVCPGDSGGPLLLDAGGVWAIAGITSAVTNTACIEGTDFFANVRNPAIAAFILGLVPEAARR
ncbi:MAG TPA: S1 family peptidase [Vicinamibacterales bacterium]|nr:S1 family peptidase [Vicinamibacterales bacterium]